MHVSSYMSRGRVYLYLTIVVSETVGGLIDESYLWIDTRVVFLAYAILHWLNIGQFSIQINWKNMII